MYVVCVSIFVKAGCEDAFVAATEKNHRGTVQEPGALRFDVLRADEEPGRFFLYEVYRDKDAFAAHQRTAHYHAWREAVAEFMDKPRQAVKYTSLFPSDEETAWTSRS